jgi:hypothetical protein
MQNELNHKSIIQKAWEEFDDRHEIKRIFDFSVRVSTNQVYKIFFYDREPVFAKLSDYGKYNYFREDHIIINNLANNLEAPYDNFLAHSLVKKNEVFVYRYYQNDRSAWVIFYNPIRIKNMLPARLDEKHIRMLGRELARFHKACTNVSNQLPYASKTVITDIKKLIKDIDKGKFSATATEKDIIKAQADTFLQNVDELSYLNNFELIPVFVDWNIGNFSIRADRKIYSRWDYDWFRVSSRVMDFYSFSRVVSDIGDRSTFSYLIDPLCEERFLLFLKQYHKIFPLSEIEVRFVKEAYRFFILNYVIKDGHHFFRPSYAQKLKKEAYELYLPVVDSKFSTDKLLKALKM